MTDQHATLRRTLSMRHIVYLGLAWMTPMIYFTVYGVAYESAGGMLTQAYLLAFVAIFFTAVSYGIMSRTYPTSGSSYTYVGKSIHPYMGFLVGWAILLDYLFSPLIACLTFGIFLNAQFPSVPVWAWIVGLNVVLAAINILGVNFSAQISKWFVWIQMSFVGVFCFFLIKNLSGGPAVHPLQPIAQTDIPLTAILAGASVICFCFLGFDSVTTMSEETKDSGRAIPRAILIIITLAGVLYLTPSYLTQLIYPNLAFEHSDTAGMELVKLVGGSGLSALFVTVLVFAIFTQGLSSFATVSRLLYVMGRDAVLPKKVFGALHPKYRTPAVNIALVAAFSMLALVISLDIAVKCVSFGALTAFTFVNLSVIVRLYIKEKRRSFKQTLLYLVCPLIGACFIGWLLSLLDRQALWIGLSWVLFGIVYHAFRYKLQPLLALPKKARVPFAPRRD
ncbi:APC family permease [Paenibacillus arenilitoris]|uniref:APC family permease n=1 Tax=Paenibacillus arenilitoris TaxID=2772299 RepID=A0A927CPC7_9BACL|nr:APC family permease [Paenibacillus arenilitoris]MBD2870323.1 APC family permease [Paenibacillus arenilitoris]